MFWEKLEEERDQTEQPNVKLQERIQDRKRSHNEGDGPADLPTTVTYRTGTSGTAGSTRV